MTTKYDINQKLWFIQDDKVVEQPVRVIEINSVSTKYTMSGEGVKNKRYENQLFPTKKDLINSL